MLRKLFLLTFIFAFYGVMAYAQIQQGAIKYELRIDMHRSIPPEREELKAMIPQLRTENFILVFNETERFYKIEEDVNQMVAQGGGRRMNFRMPSMEIYSNHATGEWLANQEFMGRNYLITDTLALAPWRLGNEFMDILGYRCQMAWYVDTVTNQEVTAWFTLAIQPFMGPDRYSTLPGTILALDVNNGERVWVAREVTARPLTRNELVKPSRGERITHQRFREMQNEQMEQMRQRGGGFRF